MPAARERGGSPLTLPASRGPSLSRVGGGEEVGVGEVGAGAAPDPLAEAAHVRPQPGLGVDLDMVRRQLADEARRDGALPGAVDAAVGGEGDGGAMAGAGDADIGEAALL